MSRRNKNKDKEDEVKRQKELSSLIADQKLDFVDTLVHSTNNKSTFKLRKRQRGMK